jgi:hypothetical protein
VICPLVSLKGSMSFGTYWSKGICEWKWGDASKEDGGLGLLKSQPSIDDM